MHTVRVQPCVSAPAAGLQTPATPCLCPSPGTRSSPGSPRGRILPAWPTGSVERPAFSPTTQQLVPILLLCFHATQSAAGGLKGLHRSRRCRLQTRGRPIPTLRLRCGRPTRRKEVCGGQGQVKWTLPLEVFLPGAGGDEGKATVRPAASPVWDKWSGERSWHGTVSQPRPWRGRLGKGVRLFIL